MFERRICVVVVMFGGNISVVNNFVNSIYYNLIYLKICVIEVLCSNLRCEGICIDLV